MVQITCTDVSLDFSYSSFFNITNFSTRFRQRSLSVISPQRDLPEIYLVLLYTWRLERVRDTKFGTNAFNEKLLNATKCQGYSFYCFLVIKRKPTG